jgi:hypothetical protein
MVVELKGPSLAERRKLPAHVEKQMRIFRDSFWPTPKDYIDFHRLIALDVLEALRKNYALRVVDVTMRDAGWFDGMEELTAIVEDRHGAVHKLVYCDSNQGFLVRCPSGGQAWFNPDTLFSRRVEE